MSHATKERERDYELHYGPGATKMTAKKRELTAGIKRVVVDAWRAGTLGRESPWYFTGPPKDWIEGTDAHRARAAS